MPPFEEERAYCFAHVCLSVWTFVTFSFSINNSRTPWPTFLKLSPHICPWQQRNPIDFGGQRSRSSGSNLSELFQIIKVTISQNEFLHTFAQLNLNRLIQLYKTSVTKKIFRAHGGIMFYKHLLFYFDCVASNLAHVNHAQICFSSQPVL